MVSTVREQLDEAIRRERELDEEYARVDGLFRRAQGDAAEARVILGSLLPGGEEYDRAEAEAAVQAGLLESYVKELVSLSNARTYNQQVQKNLRGQIENPDALANHLQVVNRAKAALATKQLRDKAILELPGAKARGRELTEEFERVEREFKEADAVMKQYDRELEALNKQAEALIESNPSATQYFPSEVEQAVWQARVESLEADRVELRANAAITDSTRQQLRLRAITLGNKLDRQRTVVRNLQERIDDPEGERMRTGNMEGGLFVPATGQRFVPGQRVM